jgi:hypothetical protein
MIVYDDYDNSYQFVNRARTDKLRCLWHIHKNTVNFDTCVTALHLTSAEEIAARYEHFNVITQNGDQFSKGTIKSYGLIVLTKSYNAIIYDSGALSAVGFLNGFAVVVEDGYITVDHAERLLPEFYYSTPYARYYQIMPTAGVIPLEGAVLASYPTGIDYNIDADALALKDGNIIAGYGIRAVKNYCFFIDDASSISESKAAIFKKAVDAGTFVSYDTFDQADDICFVTADCPQLQMQRIRQAMINFKTLDGASWLKLMKRPASSALSINALIETAALYNSVPEEKRDEYVTGYLYSSELLGLYFAEGDLSVLFDGARSSFVLLKDGMAELIQLFNEKYGEYKNKIIKASIDAINVIINLVETKGRSVFVQYLKDYVCGKLTPSVDDSFAVRVIEMLTSINAATGNRSQAALDFFKSHFDEHTGLFDEKAQQVMAEAFVAPTSQASIIVPSDLRPVYFGASETDTNKSQESLLSHASIWFDPELFSAALNGQEIEFDIQVANADSDDATSTFAWAIKGSGSWRELFPAHALVDAAAAATAGTVINALGNGLVSFFGDGCACDPSDIDAALANATDWEVSTGIGPWKKDHNAFDDVDSSKWSIQALRIIGYAGNTRLAIQVDVLSQQIGKRFSEDVDNQDVAKAVRSAWSSSPDVKVRVSGVGSTTSLWQTIAAIATGNGFKLVSSVFSGVFGGGSYVDVPPVIVTLTNIKEGNLPIVKDAVMSVPVAYANASHAGVTPKLASAFISSISHAAAELAFIYVKPMIEAIEAIGAEQAAVARIAGGYYYLQDITNFAVIDANYLAAISKLVDLVQKEEATKRVRDDFSSFFTIINSYVEAAKSANPIYFLRYEAYDSGVRYQDDRALALYLAYAMDTEE